MKRFLAITMVIILAIPLLTACPFSNSGVNTFSAEDCFLMMSYEVHRTDLFDFDTWLYTFELPMENGIAELIDHWKEPAPGMIVIDMTITVTLID